MIDWPKKETDTCGETEEKGEKGEWYLVKERYLERL